MCNASKQCFFLDKEFHGVSYCKLLFQGFFKLLLFFYLSRSMTAARHTECRGISEMLFNAFLNLRRNCFQPLLAQTPSIIIIQSQMTSSLIPPPPTFSMQWDSNAIFAHFFPSPSLQSKLFFLLHFLFYLLASQLQPPLWLLSLIDLCSISPRTPAYLSHQPFSSLRPDPSFTISNSSQCGLAQMNNSLWMLTVP